MPGEGVAEVPTEDLALLKVNELAVYVTTRTTPPTRTLVAVLRAGNLRMRRRWTMR